MEKKEENSLEFAIIGAQKSATTSLLNALKSHSDVWMPAGETRVFEDPFFNEESLVQFRKTIGKSAEVRGIKRPDLLPDLKSIKRLLENFPDVKLVLVLRDPVDRAISAYYHYIRYDGLPVVDHEEGFARIFSGAVSYTHLTLPTIYAV